MLKDKLEEMLFVQLAGWFEQYENVLPFGQGAFVDVKSAQDLHEIWATFRFPVPDSLRITSEGKTLDTFTGTRRLRAR